MTTEIRCDFCHQIKGVNDLYRVDFWEYIKVATRNGHKKVLRLDMCRECFKRLIKK